MNTTVVVSTPEDLKQVVADYLEFEEFAFDVETTGTRASRAPKDIPELDVMTNEVWCISLAGPGRSDVIPCGHPDSRNQLMRGQVFEGLEPLLFSDRRKINQNVAFDLTTIAKYYGQLPPPPYGDTMIAAFLLNENLPSYKLGFLSEGYLFYTYAEKLGREAYSAPFWQAMRYSLVDAKVAWLLWNKLLPHFSQELYELLELEMDVLAVLADMRLTGAYVDKDRFEGLVPELENQLAEMKRRVRETGSRHFPDTFFNSPKQRNDYFYGELELQCNTYTKKGAKSTNAKALSVLAKKNPTARALLRHAEIQKILSTYINGFIPCIDADNRIRANLNQAVAKTGRLSCSQPNLQNIPARYRANTEGDMIRKLFEAPAGKRLIVADYSQIELRILAHLSKDRRLVEAFQSGVDLHTQTASLIWRIPPEKVTKEQRATAKNSNFAFAFGGGPGRVQEMAGVSEAQAMKIYAAWHEAYPGVKRYGRRATILCQDKGYASTLYGRRRRLPEIYSDNSFNRSSAERQAINSPIQGTAADIAKFAMVQIQRSLVGHDARLILFVHDEFVIEVAESEVDEVVALVRSAMEDVQRDGKPVLDVPLIADISVGPNWAEAKG